MTLGRRILLRVADLIRGSRPWHRQSTYPGLLSLLAIRTRLRFYNLTDTSTIAHAETGDGTTPDNGSRRTRSADGTFNDTARPRMGAAGTRFGRNVPLWGGGKDEPPDLMTPSPREVSRRLLAPLTADTPWLDELRSVHAAAGMTTDFSARLGRSGAPIINLLSAAWIQFMIHDWVSHGSNRREEPFAVPLADGDPWPRDPMLIRRTRSDASNAEPGGLPTFLNTETHWWDGSQIYGSTPERLALLRRGETDGHLRIDATTRLLPLEDEDGNPRTGRVDLTGVNGNWWLGLSLLHSLFTLEHNHLCDRFREQHPEWDDDRVFDQARLVNAALMAKIHTIEWTPAILPHRILDKAMHGNWSGLFGPRIARRLRALGVRSDLLIGIPGSRVDHHGAAYALTEEFVSVYRLHALIPDEIRLRNGDVETAHPMAALSGGESRAVLESHDFADLWRAFGRQEAGAVRLHNFPETLRSLPKPDEDDPDRRIDLAAIDVMRDRERGVPRYGAFRQMLRLPVPETFLITPDGPPGITDDPVWAHELEQLYEHPDRVDLMVGLYAEPLPEGFGFSETALHIFALMASRRLKSDRFFTDDYRPGIYTDFGIKWIEENTMASVMARHVPELAAELDSVGNPFAPWGRS